MADKLIMKKYYIKTYGCQMNTSDSERISAVLNSTNMESTREMREADVVVFNTCSVRQSAEDRVYGQLHNIGKLKKDKSDIKVVLTGCMAKRDIVKKKAKNVDFFIDIKEIERLPQELGL